MIKYNLRIYNSLLDIAKKTGIKHSVILNKANNLGVKVIKDEYVSCVDAMSILDQLKVKYTFSLSDDTVNKIIEEQKKVQTDSNTVFGVVGHIGHGKTTFISRFVGSEITEAYSITQNVSIYRNGDFYFLDTPGHGVFSSIRHIISNVVDYWLLVISLYEGIEFETRAILNFLAENNLCEKTIVVFTKSQMAKHKIEDLMSYLESEHDIACYFVFDLDDSVDKIRSNIDKALINNRLLSSKSNPSNNYLFNKVNVAGKTMYLVCARSGQVTKKSRIVINKIPYKVSKIMDYALKKSLPAAKGINFFYLEVDCFLEFDRCEVYFTSNEDYIDQLEKDEVLRASVEDDRVKTPVALKHNTCLVSDSVTRSVLCSVLGEKNEIFDVVVINEEYIYATDKDKKYIGFNLDADDVERMQRRGLSVLNFNSIYLLLEHFEKINSNIENNTAVKSLACIVKIFNISGKTIYGCQLMRGCFNMNQEVHYKLQSKDIDLDLKCRLASIKVEDKFIKKMTNVQGFFGVILDKKQIALVEGDYFYSFVS